MYKNKDGKIQAKVEKVSKQKKELLQGDQANQFVANVINHLGISENMDRKAIVDNALSVLKLDRGKWKVIELDVEFSGGKELEFEFKNPIYKEKDENEEKERDHNKEEEDDD